MVEGSQLAEKYIIEIIFFTNFLLQIEITKASQTRCDKIFQKLCKAYLCEIFATDQISLHLSIYKPTVPIRYL